MARKGKTTRMILYPARMDIRTLQEQHDWANKEANKQGITVSQMFRDWIDEKRGK